MQPYWACGDVSAGRGVLGEADVGPSVCVKFPRDGGRVKISDLFRTFNVPAAFHMNIANRIESVESLGEAIHFSQLKQSTEGNDLQTMRPVQNGMLALVSKYSQIMQVLIHSEMTASKPCLCGNVYA